MLRFYVFPRQIGPTSQRMAEGVLGTLILIWQRSREKLDFEEPLGAWLAVSSQQDRQEDGGSVLVFWYHVSLPYLVPKTVTWFGKRDAWKPLYFP